MRIEDTDVERSKKEYEKDILESLKWLGIEWDEGPFRQSERIDIYKKYLQKLLNEDKAYYCFCSEEELEAQRQYKMSLGEAPRYSGKCANLSKKEVEKCLQEGKKPVIRFRVPEKKVVFEDLIRGKLEFDSSLFGDVIIAKDLNTPLYNFAVIIDDFEMKINYIIRGEEHLSNTPKQILIQEVLGFPIPKFAHLPLILGPDRSKLSKRHGAIPTRQYREDGYLPEALINFLAFLGWNPGTEREIYSLASLVKEFSIDRIQKGGAIFNIKRLDFLNGFYIRQKSVEKLTELCLPYLIKNGLIEPVFKTGRYPPAYGASEIIQAYKISATGEEIGFEHLKKIVALYQERLKKLSEISGLVDYFFKEMVDFDRGLLKWRETTEEETLTAFTKLEGILSETKDSDWTKEKLEKKLVPEAEKFGEEIGKTGDRGYLLWPFRVALTGKKASAGPFEVAEILGKEKTLKRIEEAKSKK